MTPRRLHIQRGKARSPIVLVELPEGLTIEDLDEISRLVKRALGQVRVLPFGGGVRVEVSR